MTVKGNNQQNSQIIRAHVLVRGIVQGVGFRPFVHRIASMRKLTGWVLNSTEGVEIEVEGLAANIDLFLNDLEHKAPPLAVIHKIDAHLLPAIGYSSFVIEKSQDSRQGFPLVSPDIATCSECLSELFDASDRRYRYPFINCTNCGPRFTIIVDIPYDRPKTTMKRFAMCPSCQKEYDDPKDRRFHAQPNACPECGPSLWLCTSPESHSDAAPPQRGKYRHLPHSDAAPPQRGKYRLQEGEGKGTVPNHLKGEGITAPSLREGAIVPPLPLGEAARRAGEGSPVEHLVGADDSVRIGLGGKADPIAEARHLLKSGAILAIKGLGGFHLACDATNTDAVLRLRQRKRRVEKPFAIMVHDLEMARKLCYITEAEARLLSSPRRPIVLLERREDAPVAAEVAPRNKRLGVMLPYTPVHHLLLDPKGDNASNVLVMTSGNISEEPIAKDNDEAISRLASLADAFLLHDRPIHVRCDDTVTQVFEDKEYIVRRSRGYAPLPVQLDFECLPVLATGAHLKNTFCIAQGNYAFLSQHIGDLENEETLDFFAYTLDHFVQIFKLRPSIVAHDLHPDYLSTRFAKSLVSNEETSTTTSKRIAVQHHHAHIAACMAENGLREPVIGVAFDGTGYGQDGAIWGGEFLLADVRSFERAAQLKYVPLPGNDAAIRKPYRMALSYLIQTFGEDLPKIDFLTGIDRSEIETIALQITKGINSPPTSSCGRLFDAVSALLGIRGEITYEGQAAIELEMSSADGVDASYEFGLFHAGLIQVDTTPVIRSIVRDMIRGEKRDVIAARFHNGVAAMIVSVCIVLRDRTKMNKVCLSGGVFQNRLLLSQTLRRLRQKGFETFIHHLVPCNDGGISLGQAVVANEMMRRQ